MSIIKKTKNFVRTAQRKYTTYQRRMTKAEENRMRMRNDELDKAIVKERKRHALLKKEKQLARLRGTSRSSSSVGVGLDFGFMGGSGKKKRGKGGDDIFGW